MTLDAPARLALALTRQEPRATVLSTLPDTPSAWTQAARRARDMDVFPLFAQGAERYAAARIPSEVLAAWHQESRAQAAYALLLETHHGALTDAFAQRGISAFPIKGPELGRILYGQASLRSFEDLDYVVPAEQLPSAAETLIAAGWNCEFPMPLPRGPLQATDPFNHEIPFTRQEGAVKLLVELHWDPFPRRQPHDAADWTPEVYALYLAMTGARNLWRPLKSLVDLRDWLAVHQASGATFDWRAFWNRARHEQLERVAATAFALLADVLEEAAPECPVHALAGDSYQALLAWVGAGSDPQSNLLRYHRLRLALFDSARLRTRYLWHLAGPAASDWDQADPNAVWRPRLRRWQRIAGVAMSAMRPST